MVTLKAKVRKYRIQSQKILNLECKTKLAESGNDTTFSKLKTTRRDHQMPRKVEHHLLSARNQFMSRVLSMSIPFELDYFN